MINDINLTVNCQIFVTLDKLLSIRTFSVNFLSLWMIFYQFSITYHVLIWTRFYQFDHCFLVVKSSKTNEEFVHFVWSTLSFGHGPCMSWGMEKDWILIQIHPQFTTLIKRSFPRKVQGCWECLLYLGCSRTSKCRCCKKVVANQRPQVCER